jgi:hypothetical protein
MTKASRPLGVTIIGGLGLLSGIFYALIGVLALIGSAVFASLLAAIPIIGLLGGAVIGIVGVVLLIWGVITIFIYLWLLQMKKIGMWIVLIFGVLGILSGIGGMFIGGGWGALASLPGLIWNAIIVWYLWSNQKKFR